ncbi:MAG: cell division protein FtsZ [Alphaproteobacteria bacterium]|nr:cell division protein FtsZ [Alphaproteobacteria bacterium]
MIKFDIPNSQSSIIKVIGVGGGGGNAVNFMYGQNIEGVDFVIVNTDSKALNKSNIPNKIQLGPNLTQGLGAGADPSKGKLATEESLEVISNILDNNTKMVFLTAGMGGGTGTGGAPVIAKLCRDRKILTVGIVTKPFKFEGPSRLRHAEEGIKALSPYVDTLLVISNEKLRENFGNFKMSEAYNKADNILATAAKCITDIINSKGHVIVDFADVCRVMKDGGHAIMGKAEMAGENRAIEAAEQALNSPLLDDNDIKGAKWLLININSAVGEHELTLDELDVISNYIKKQSGPESDVIFGQGYDETLGDKISVTVIATGFQRDNFNKLTETKIEKEILNVSDNHSFSNQNTELLGFGIDQPNILPLDTTQLTQTEQPNTNFTNQVKILHPEKNNAYEENILNIKMKGEPKNEVVNVKEENNELIEDKKNSDPLCDFYFYEKTDETIKNPNNSDSYNDSFSTSDFFQTPHNSYNLSADEEPVILDLTFNPNSNDFQSPESQMLTETDKPQLFNPPHLPEVIHDFTSTNQNIETTKNEKSVSNFNKTTTTIVDEFNDSYPKDDAQFDLPNNKFNDNKKFKDLKYQSIFKPGSKNNAPNEFDLNKYNSNYGDDDCNLPGLSGNSLSNKIIGAPNNRGGYEKTISNNFINETLDNGLSC